MVQQVSLRAHYLGIKNEHALLLQTNLMPSTQQIQQVLSQLPDKEAEHTQQVKILKDAHAKAISVQLSQSHQLKEESSALVEQINEYKGLTAQLQLEKADLLKVQDKLTKSMADTKTLLAQKEFLYSDKLEAATNNHKDALSTKVSEIEALREELDRVRN